LDTIPKCKKCKYFWTYNIGKHNYYECYNDNVYPIGAKIYAKDIKTSPKWCPLRKELK
jgi:hypothetical protein